MCEIRCGLVVRIPGLYPGGPGSIPGIGKLNFFEKDSAPFHTSSSSSFFFYLGSSKKWSKIQEMIQDRLRLFRGIITGAVSVKDFRNKTFVILFQTLVISRLHGRELLWLSFISRQSLKIASLDCYAQMKSFLEIQCVWCTYQCFSPRGGRSGLPQGIRQFWKIWVLIPYPCDAILCPKSPGRTF